MTDYLRPTSRPLFGGQTPNYALGGEAVIDPWSASAGHTFSAGRQDIVTFQATRSEMVHSIRTLTGGTGVTVTGGYVGMYRQSTTRRNLYELVGQSADVGASGAWDTTYSVFDIALSAPVMKSAGEMYALAVLPIGASPVSYGRPRGFVDNVAQGQVFKESWVVAARLSATGLTELAASVDLEDNVSSPTVSMLSAAPYLAALGEEN